MKEYIFGDKNSIHIIDLTQTVVFFKNALSEIHKCISKGGKILLVSTFVPIFIISNRGFESEHIPFWGALSGWVLFIIFGREALITIFRSYGARQGIIIAAGKSGKRKTLLQFLFAGGLLLWYPLNILATAQAWDGVGWALSEVFFLAWSVITLPLAILMTIYSMMYYLWSYRALVGSKR